MYGHTSRVEYGSAVLLLAITAACGADLPTRPQWNGVGVLGEYIVHLGTTRRYSLNVPSSHRASEPAPLLIMFHGAGDNGAGFQQWSALDSVAEAAGFITAYPNGKGSPCLDDPPQETPEDCPPYGWPSEEIEFVRQLIAHLRYELTIDPRRIFAAGFSFGAVFTHEVACDVEDVAGAAVVSALLYPQLAARCDPPRPVSMLLMNGTLDEVYPWAGDFFLSVASTVDVWTTLNGCTGDPMVEWLPDTEDDGTRVWTETYGTCDGGAEVRLYGIESGGHTWPGVSGFPPRLGLTSHDISASAEIVEFMVQHGRR